MLDTVRSHVLPTMSENRTSLSVSGFAEAIRQGHHRHLRQHPIWYGVPSYRLPSGVCSNLYLATSVTVYNISNTEARSLMGERQESWFYDQLKESKKRQAKWRLIGQQIVFSQLNYSAAEPDYL